MGDGRRLDFDLADDVGVPGVVACRNAFVAATTTVVERAGAAHAEITGPSGSGRGAVGLAVHVADDWSPDAESCRVLAAVVARLRAVLAAHTAAERAEAARVLRRGVDRQLEAVRDELPRAQQFERRALVAELIGTVRPQLDALTTAVRDIGVAIDRGELATAAGTSAEWESSLEQLSTTFREFVTGAHSKVLESRGLYAALRRLAEGMPGEVRVTCATDAVVPSAETSSTAYYVVALLLRTLGHRTAEPVSVTLSGTDLDTIRIALDTGAPVPTVRSAAASVGSHLTALGGRIWIDDDAERTTITFELPRRITAPPPVVSVAPARVPGLRYNVRRLVSLVAIRHPALAVRRQALTLLDRFGGPLRVQSTVAVPAQSLPAGVLVTDTAPHVVLGRPDLPAPAFPAAADGPLVVPCEAGAQATVLATRVLPWDDVVRARAVLHELHVLLGGRAGATIPDDLITGEAERVALAAAQELQELALVLDPRAATTTLEPAVAEEVLRLVGAHGRDPRRRLGLPATTDDAATLAAASAAADRWRVRAEAATATPRTTLFRIVARSCEHTRHVLATESAPSALTPA